MESSAECPAAAGMTGFDVCAGVSRAEPDTFPPSAGNVAVMPNTNSGRLTDHVSLGVLTRIIPRYLVDEVIAETGRREKRVRSLPAHVVVYFVVALALFADGYEEVIRKLVNGLRFARVWSTGWAVPTTGGLSQARARLGEAPLKELFAKVAVPVAKAGTPGAWAGRWRVMAIDGVMLDLPDTTANLACYPKVDGGTRRPFPQLRAVGLVEAGSHAVVDAELGSFHDGERALAARLARSLDPTMLVTADRGFPSFELWRDLSATGAELLWRVPSTIKLEPLAELEDGSWIAEIAEKSARGASFRIDADKVGDARLASHLKVRVVSYKVTGVAGDGSASPVYRLITSILDPEALSAAELAAVYHERWEIESAFKEIEVYLRDGGGIRSKTPEMVRQEVWGLFLAHYAVRAFMVEAADTVDMDPDRLSFTRTLHIVRRRITDSAAFSPQSPE